MILLTSVILTVALSFYIDLSNATQRAVDEMRSMRRANAILDRIARDLEGTMLITKPGDADPLSHPWVFLAERHYAEAGSDHVKFNIQNNAPRSRDEATSNVGVVAYTVEPNEDENLRLLRWTSSRLSDGLDSTFPPEEESLQLSDDLLSFSMQFLSENGEWDSEWDSSQVRHSNALPLAVGIELALNDAKLGDSDEFETFEDQGPKIYRRTVTLPLRPLDMEELLDPARLESQALPEVVGDDEEVEDEDEMGQEDGQENRGTQSGSGRSSASNSGDDDDRMGGLTVADCVVVEPSARVAYFYEQAPRKKMSSFPPGWFEGPNGQGVHLRPGCQP